MKLVKRTVIPLEFSWSALIEPFFLAIFLRVFSKLFGILGMDLPGCSRDVLSQSFQLWRDRLFISEIYVSYRGVAVFPPGPLCLTWQRSASKSPSRQIRRVQGLLPAMAGGVEPHNRVTFPEPRNCQRTRCSASCTVQFLDGLSLDLFST